MLSSSLEVSEISPPLSLGIPPIFIVGMPRSGTTLVSMVLNGHSQICISPETHYYGSIYRKGERRRCRSSDDLFKRYVRFVLSSKQMQGFAFSDEERDLLYRRITHSGVRSHRVVLSTLLSFYATRQGKAIYGEKTPMHMHHVDTIMASFPDARILLVVRDPRDVILSLKRVTWERGNMLEHLALWKRSVEYINAYARAYGAQFLVVRYEDLLSGPEDTVRRICSFLAVTFEEGMLAFHQLPVPNFDVNAEPWKAKTLQPIDPRNQLKWKAHMSRQECAIIEAQAAEELKQLGYPLAYYPLDLATRLQWAYLYAENAALLGRHWLRRAWLRLASGY